MIEELPTLEEFVKEINSQLEDLGLEEQNEMSLGMLEKVYYDTFRDMYQEAPEFEVDKYGRITIVLDKKDET